MSNMLEAVRLWLKSSPILKNDRIGIDYLSNEADSWAVAMSPTQPVVKKYINGAYVGQFEFIIASRQQFGDNLNNNAQNIEVCEKLAEWLISAPTLPDFGEEKDTQKCEIVSSGYISSANAQTARYEIRAKIIYIKH